MWLCQLAPVRPNRLELPPIVFIARLFGTRNPLPNLRQTWNMVPTMSAPVVRRQPETGERHLDPLAWGLAGRVHQRRASLALRFLNHINRDLFRYP